MPVVFDKISLKLIDDYDAIGNALEAGDISGAQRAVVRLKHDIQEIGHTENPSSWNSNIVGARNTAAAANNIIRSYYSGNNRRVLHRHKYRHYNMNLTFKNTIGKS
jgi:hypothetical protein